MQAGGKAFGATLSSSLEQHLSEKLQQIRLHLAELRESLHHNSWALTPEVVHGMQASISGATKAAGEAKEVAEVLKASPVFFSGLEHKSTVNCTHRSRRL